MSFTAFSKEFTANMFTSVENQFITKYLPQADGDAVRAYLYGLYLCSCKDEFDARAMSKLLRIEYSRLLDIFGYWEECDLVHILSKDPLFVEFLPVNHSAGRPKTVRAEKYSGFNRELLKLLQKTGKDFKPYEHQRILEFLENYPMEQEAFVLVAEYCAKKDGEKLSSQHILNKAKKLCQEHKYTFEQVEREFSDYNEGTEELSAIYSLLGIYRKVQESDLAYLIRWKQAGLGSDVAKLCASYLKKGSMATLDALVSELLEKEITTKPAAKEYLEQRTQKADLVFQVAKKLGVRVQNPRAYIEEYADKWLERGFEAESLVKIAAFCFKLGYDFQGMDGIVSSMFEQGFIDENSAEDYLSARERQLKLLQSLQSVCGVLKKTIASLDMIAAWKSWELPDEVIMEAAKRSAGASAPLPYMNKLLSEWKREGVKDIRSIPEQTRTLPAAKREFKSEAQMAADLRGEREHYYAVLRQKAQEQAERNRKLAENDREFAQTDAAVKRGEIELAKAEVFAPDRAGTIKEQLEALRQKRAAALSRLSLSERDLQPRYACLKCSDTGFLPDGRACDCYPANK